MTLLALSIAVHADVEPAGIFTDNMVLQRGKPLPVWGRADPGEKITVTFADKSVTTAAGPEGTWQVTLPPMPAGGPHTMNFAASNTVTIENVMLGDVWLCAGQSNMNMSVKLCDNADNEIKTADHPGIRLYHVRRRILDTPARDVNVQWQICSPKTVPDFSAAAYYFGRYVHKHIGVPIGLIQAAVNDSPAESWMRREALDVDNPHIKNTLTRWAARMERYPEAKADYEKKLAEWKQTRPTPRPPRKPIGPGHQHQPSGCYNGMIAPLVPLAIKGVTWYQGEANVWRAYAYTDLFSALIADWRKTFDQGDFPFIFTQLTAAKNPRPTPYESGWANLRWAQLLTHKSVPETGIAVTLDIGSSETYHPTNKQTVGRRLALWAMKLVYDKDTVPCGPLYKSMTVEDDKIRIAFMHAGSGLVARDGLPLEGFAIAGDDRQFVWADARIDGETVLVHSDAIKNPVAVRYAWADYPECNLFNREGLPASTFRTDDWALVKVPR